MSSFPFFIPIIIIAYLIGSVPFGFLITRMAGLGDIRKVGSGNIGATNVLRTGKKGLAFLTLVLDGGKGAVVVLIAIKIFKLQFLDENNIFDQRVYDYAYLTAFAVFIGHLFPVWLKFKGGKGVATAVGTITALCWPIGIGVMISWMIIAAVTGYSSLAALIALGLVPFVCLYMKLPHAAILGFAIFGFIAYKHKDNIRRLIKRKEPKIWKEKK